MLREGVLDAIIDQNPRMEAQRALAILARHFNRAALGAKSGEYTPFNGCSLLPGIGKFGQGAEIILLFVVVEGFA